MKKLLCILLTMALIMSLAACGKTTSTPPVEAEINNTSTAEEIQTESSAIIEDDTPDETEPINTEPQIATYETWEECENKIHELGFTEFSAKHPLFDETVLFPTSLTFTENSFKLEFNYKNYDFNSEQFVDETWVLYGAKNTGPAYIAEHQGEGYGSVYSNDFAELPEYDASYLHEVEYLTSKVTGDLVENVMTMAYYFTTTSNLYNLTTITSAIEITTGYPQVIEFSFK